MEHQPFVEHFSWGNHGFSTSMLVYSSLSPKVVLIWVSREDNATEYCLFMLVHHTSSQTCACGGRYKGMEAYFFLDFFLLRLWIFFWVSRFILLSPFFLLFCFFCLFAFFACLLFLLFSFFAFLLFLLFCFFCFFAFLLVCFFACLLLCFFAFCFFCFFAFLLFCFFACLLSVFLLFVIFAFFAFLLFACLLLAFGLLSMSFWWYFLVCQTCTFFSTLV